MTLVSSIITDAYRESQLVAIVSTPTALEITEATRRLNTLVSSTIGNEAGQQLVDLNIGGPFDQSGCLPEWIPDDSRLILNLAGARTLKLDPQPYDGQRVAVVDAGANLATHNLVLNGNGRTIETTATITLNTNSLARQWMYRGDLGNWVRLTSLTTADQLPFPEEFDDYFITMLAMRLNPRHGQSMSQESIAALDRQRLQLEARYRKPRPRQDAGTYGLLGQSGFRDERSLMR